MLDYIYSNVCVKCIGARNLIGDVLVCQLTKYQTREVLMGQEDQTPSRGSLDRLTIKHLVGGTVD